VHALDVVGTRDTVRDVPTTLHDPLVGGNVVTNEPEDHHHDVLGDADGVAISHFGHSDAAINRRLKVDMVGADARGQRELQFLGLGDTLGREIGRPEGL